jgi:hypothetical protein
VGADDSRLFFVENIARYRPNRAGEPVHIGNGKTGRAKSQRRPGCVCACTLLQGGCRREPNEETTMGGLKPQDFPPGLQGGLEHDEENHRLGETGQTGPEAIGDINRGHPEQTGIEDKARKDGDKA